MDDYSNLHRYCWLYTKSKMKGASFFAGNLTLVLCLCDLSLLLCRQFSAECKKKLVSKGYTWRTVAFLNWLKNMCKFLAGSGSPCQYNLKRWESEGARFMLNIAARVQVLPLCVVLAIAYSAEETTVTLRAMSISQSRTCCCTIGVTLSRASESTGA